LLPFLLSILGAVTSFVIYAFFYKRFFLFKVNSALFRTFYTFLNKKWYVDRIYNYLVAKNVLNLSYSFFYKCVDRGVIEQFGPIGVINIIRSRSSSVKSLHTGSIFHYIFFFSIIQFLLISFIVNFSACFLLLEIIILFFFTLLIL
jgi:NADH:ubiquinone oxidoreductase subunit 5 (subunit L)/multisubunit Na+/H+ antiporter MnhA subunit